MATNPTLGWLTRLAILGTPLTLGILELWHPKRFPKVFYDLLPVVEQ